MKRYGEGGFTFFRISLSNFPAGSCETAVEPRKSSQIRLNLKFKSALTENIRLYCVSRNWVSLFLDSTRAVIRQYAI